MVNVKTICPKVTSQGLYSEEYEFAKIFSLLFKERHIGIIRGEQRIEASPPINGTASPTSGR